jgi:HK97 family phage portal protein
MSLLGELLRPRAAITTSYQLLEELSRQGALAESGATVTPETAMRLSWVYAAVRALAEDLAKVPLLLYRRLGRGKERATDHPVYRLLHDEPNPWQTSFEFREMLQSHVALAGDGFALITRVRGEVRELLPVPPWRMEVARQTDGRPLYTLTWPDGQRTPVPPERLLHLPGLLFDGVRGLSPIGYQREAIGLGIQLTRHAAKLFKQGALLGGVIEHPQRLSEKAHARLKEDFEEKYTSVDQAHKVLLLEEGAKFTATGMTSRDAQFLEARKLGRSEIAAIFRLPPHKIGDLERSTFSNIEQQALEYVTDSLQPWFTRWEQRLTRALLPPEDRERYVVEHLVEGLLRGDFKTRMEGYAVGVQNGWLSRNEVRVKENMNPVDGLDEYLQPLNMQPSGSEGAV